VATTICASISLSTAALCQGSDAAQSCQRLATTKLDAAKVTSAALVSSGSVPPQWGLSPTRTQALKGFCRVEILDQPSADSTIHTEVWLPIAGWNGKLSTRGNGGFAGELSYDQMAASVSEDYATAGTDTGHSTTPREFGNPGFALGHPEKVKDFGWRAIHDMTVQAKVLVNAFYGKPQTKSYFASCSTGGRQALMEAQRFPADYDGILAGAPAYNYTALLGRAGADEKTLLATADSYIPASKLSAITLAVLAACDAQDGLKDGILNDPRTCHFDPAKLLCQHGDEASCLLPEQVRTLKEIYSAKITRSGETIYPGIMPGAEDAPGSWAPWIVANKAGELTFAQFFAEAYYRDFVHQDPAWKLASFDLSADYKLSNEKTAADLNATDPNLTAFTAHGGKLILYHGWNDPAISPLATINYYEAVRSTTGSSTADTSVRLYVVPGMLHCVGGPGATEFGQDLAGERGDAQHDVLTSLEQWVESARVPGKLLAKGKSISRPICPYPSQAKYVSGDNHAADSFVCDSGTH
jgi:feruloyl esterase